MNLEHIAKIETKIKKLEQSIQKKGFLVSKEEKELLKKYELLLLECYKKINI